MNLPRTLAQRPTPRMPGLAGLEPRFDAIPTRTHQPTPAVRPLYWWAKDLRERGDILMGVRFDAARLEAALTVRLASYRVVEVLRRPDDKPPMPHDDVPALLADGVWRLGALGFIDHLDALLDLLRADGLISAPASDRRCTKQIPGWVSQPDAVRIAYWWALPLLRRGWRLHACGDALARYGFIAEIPAVDGRSMMLVIYPGDMADDGTEASALANYLARLGKGQRQFLQRVLAEPRRGRTG